MVEWTGVSAWISTSRNEAAMTIQVIETKRQPSLWSVKKGKRFKASFIGADARAKAEAHAATLGDYVVVERPIPAREARRRELLAAK
jgi:hypothetical protein